MKPLSYSKIVLNETDDRRYAQFVSLFCLIFLIHRKFPIHFHTNEKTNDNKQNRTKTRLLQKVATKAIIMRHFHCHHRHNYRQNMCKKLAFVCLHNNILFHIQLDILALPFFQLPHRLCLCVGKQQNETKRKEFALIYIQPL